MKILCKSKIIRTLTNFLRSLLYTVMKRPEKCFQCLQIWRRHENAVQFRIGACVKNIDQVCY